MDTHNWPTIVLVALLSLVVLGAAAFAIGILELPDGHQGDAALPRLALASDADSAAPASSASLTPDPATPGFGAPIVSGEQALDAAAPRALIEPRRFDAAAAMADIRALAAFGPRAGGSVAELKAARYIEERLEAIGLDPRIEEFPLPDGTLSRNVIARVAGSSADVVVLGAHYDTKPPSPGANDNATGCAVLLEIAGILREQPATATVEFVFFGAEETVDENPDHHHFGSRYRVSRMTAAEREATVGMLSVDMVGYGTRLHTRTMGKGPRSLSDTILAHARASGVPMSYLPDTGATGWSDHEPYELAGIPAAWIEWRDDPDYHTERDTAAHISERKVETVGRLVLDVVRSL